MNGGSFGYVYVKIQDMAMELQQSIGGGPETKRPLIRYAGSAVETSIGSKPLGSELTIKTKTEAMLCQRHASDWSELERIQGDSR